MLSPSRFVLVLGDDGALLVLVSGKRVRDAWFVPADAEEGPQGLAPYLALNRKAPVTVLVDVLEQVYRDESLPKVNPFDRAKVLKRRIDLAFPGDEMKAALPVRKTGADGASYLLTALPLSPPLAGWLEFLSKLPNPFEGFALLPLESLRMARELARAPTGEGRQWFALIGQHVTGGFRQIIETEGRLVVTRLTQPPAPDTPAAEVATQIEREFRSTLTYIKRMGYVEGDHLDAVVLAEPTVVEALANQALPATRVTALTPYQAGERLGLKRVADPQGGFSDAVHAAWAAGRKPTMVLKTPLMRRRQAIAASGTWAARAAALATAATLGFAAYIMTVNAEMQDEIDAAGVRLAHAQGELRQAEALLRGLPVPPDEMRQLIAAYDDLGRKALPLPTFLATLTQALGDDARIDALSIQAQAAKDAPPQGGRRPAAQAKPDGIEVTMTVRFLAPLPDRREAVDAAYALRDRMRGLLAPYDVQVARLPVPVLPGESLQGKLAEPAGAKQEPRRADFVIRGKL